MERNQQERCIKISKPTRGKEKAEKLKEARSEGEKSLIVRGYEMERGDVEG